MIHRLFTLAAFLSLLLCVATVALWVRSHWIEDEITGDWKFRETWAVGVCHQDGEFFAYAAEQPGSPPIERLTYSSAPAIPDRYVPSPGSREDIFFSVLGMKFLASWDQRGVPKHDFVLPDWMVVLLFLLLPSLQMWLWRKSTVHRTALGRLCRTCSYNLTGNSSGVCPECGTATTING